MNKLLGVSIAAMLAVTPMMANAANSVAQLPTYTVEQANTNIATTSYVKGAYNTVANQVNNIKNDITVDTSEAKNISANNTIGGNVTALDTAIGNVGTLASGAVANSVLTEQGNAADLVTAVIAINDALATTTGDAKVGAGTYNYVVAGATGASNLVKLDTAVGQLDTNTTHYHIGTMGTASGDPTVASNLEALDTAMGKVTETNANEYAHLTGGASVAANLIELNSAVVSNDTAIGHLNAGDNDSLSVDYKVKNNARNALFTPTATGLSSTTLQAAINEVQTNLNSANTDAALLEGNYYYYDTVEGENGHTKDTVAGAIKKVDAQVKRNEQAITAINNTQIPLFGNWASETASDNVTIAQLTAGN